MPERLLGVEASVAAGAVERSEDRATRALNYLARRHTGLHGSDCRPQDELGSPPVRARLRTCKPAYFRSDIQI